MGRFTETLRRLQQGSTLQLLLGLGGAAAVLFVAAVVGLFAVGNDETSLTAGSTTATSGLGLGDSGATGAEDTSTTVAGNLPGATVGGTVNIPKSAGSGSRSGGGTSGGASASGGGSTASAPGADRTGVTDKTVRWGLHAPKTFDGAPLNLAEDPLKGVEQIYLPQINNAGGVNGRKIDYVFADDRYTVDGGKAAGNALVDDAKAFFVSGTLGIDQIAQVAAEAKKRNTPYLAGGGSEPDIKSFDMFQVAASYDTHLIKLADYLGKEIKSQGSPYFGLKNVGVSSLDSPYILPAVNKAFKNALADNGLELKKVVTVKKPTEQTSYGTQLQELKDAGVQIFVPTQDPITTSREVQECVQQRCPWKYAASDFAHESDTALTLMGGQWTGMRALSGGCYYLAPTAYDTTKCGAMKQAHEIWVAINGESDWQKDGSGGASGFQLTHIWLKALKEAGADLTRERFRAALLAYDNYNDLVSGPITYKGSSNISHGAELMVVFEGTGNPGPANSGAAQTWKQLTPGFVDHF